MSSSVPEGNSAVTAHLVIRGRSEAIAFYVEAFGARGDGRAGRT